MIRLFTALPLPEDVRGRFAALSGGIPSARWVPAENMHITLRFLGEVNEDMAAEIELALRRIEAPALEIAIDGVGHFGHGRKIRSVWAAVASNSALVELHQRIERALVAIGLAPESRKFVPHVTLARFRPLSGAQLTDFMTGHGNLRAGPFTVDRFHLYVSHLTHRGPEYEPIAEYPLRSVASIAPSGS